MRYPRAFAFIVLIVLTLGAAAALAQDAPVPEISDSLPSSAHFGLSIIRGQLLSDLAEYNKRVDLFNAACGRIDPKDTALIASCTEKYHIMTDVAAALEKNKKEFAAQLDAEVFAVKNDMSGPPASPEQRLQNADKLAIKREIEGIRNALAQLNKSMELDASQRDEWLKESGDATRDAYFLAGSTTLDIFGYHAEDRVKAVDAELKQSEDLLYGTTATANLRSQLHTKCGMLIDSKKELEGVRDRIGQVQDAFELGTKVAKMGVDGEIPVESGFEAAWALAEKAKFMPREGHLAKTIVEGSYLVAVQAASTLRLRALNNNSDQYAAATKILQSKMEELVKAEKLFNKKHGETGGHDTYSPPTPTSTSGLHVFSAERLHIITRLWRTIIT